MLLMFEQLDFASSFYLENRMKGRHARRRRKKSGAKIHQMCLWLKAENVFKTPVWRSRSLSLSCSLTNSRHRNCVLSSWSCCLDNGRQPQVSPPGLVLQVSDGPSLLLNSPILVASAPAQPAAEAPCSEEHQVQLLKKQLQQQEQQALAASAQVLTPFTDTALCLTNNLYFFCAAVLILSRWGVITEAGNISSHCLPFGSPSGCHSHAVSWINVQYDGSRAPELSL